MKTAEKFLLQVALILLVISCASLGLVQPKTFNQRLVYAYSSVTSVRQVAKSLLESGAITVKDAGDVQAQADTTRELLDSARSAEGLDDMTTAEGKLAMAQKLLTTLQTYLKSKGVSE